MIRHALARALASLVLVAAGASASVAATKTRKPTAIPFVDDAAKPAAPADAAPKKSAGVPLLPGSGSKEPVNITADKLDFLNKDNKLIYSGNVVVVQGESTLKASVLNIDLQRDAAGAGGATAPATPAPAAGGSSTPGQGSSVKHMEADGPVTLISKDQVGTGDHATYDKGSNKVYLNGNVTLSQQGGNITQGDHLVYDMTSGQAQIFSGQTNGGRVTSVFTPGSGTPGGPPKASPAPAAPGKGKTPRRGEDAAARDAEAAR